MKSIRILIALWCAAGTLVAATPRALADDGAQPTPLPFIGATHSRAFCTSVRELVVPALATLMRVDEQIGASRALLLGAAAHPQDAAAARQPESNHDADIARVRLSASVLRMAHDLAVVQRIVDDPKRFAGSSDDRERARALEKQLKVVAERQAGALDLINGMLETELEGQMRTEYDSKLAAAVGKVGSKAGGFGQPLAGSGLQMKEPIPILDRRALLTGSTVPLVVAAARECGAPDKQP